MHETSKRLSQTLRDVYESDWNGVGELPAITEVSFGCVYGIQVVILVSQPHSQRFWFNETLLK